MFTYNPWISRKQIIVYEVSGLIGLVISLLLLFGFDSDSYGTFSSSEVSHLRQEPVIKLFNMDHGQCVYLVIIIPQGRTAFIMIVIYFYLELLSSRISTSRRT